MFFIHYVEWFGQFAISWNDQEIIYTKVLIEGNLLEHI